MSAAHTGFAREGICSFAAKSVIIDGAVAIEHELENAGAARLAAQFVPW